MSRKVTIEIKTKVIIDLNEGVEICDAVGELQYDYTSDDGNIVDTEMLDYEVIDSK